MPKPNITLPSKNPNGTLMFNWLSIDVKKITAKSNCLKQQ